MCFERLIFHVDVNSAYLSWEAVYRLQQGSDIDLRKIVSAIGGDEKSRHGIILAKSIPAKEYNIKTGQSLYEARQQCPHIVLVPPRYDLYMRCSNAMQNILLEYTPQIQRFSVDESFLDLTGVKYKYEDPIQLANEIKDRIYKELGFTVNVGISTNKLLAKMASDFKKPNMVHTLFEEEIKEKMWPLPVEDLFMCGRATAPKLHKLNIFTIGDLANYDVNILTEKLKSFGILLWQYANGKEASVVRKSNYIEMKGIGNSTTIAFDVKEEKDAHLVLLSLAESVSMRLRDARCCCRLVSVSIKGSEFVSYSRQRKLSYATDSTKKIAQIAFELFKEIWKGEAIRHLGIRVSELCSNEFNQVTLFDDKDIDKNKTIDDTIDKIRLKFGNKSIVRATFLHSGIKPITGGVGEEDYPMMGSLL